MNLQSRPATVGARVVDSLPFSEGGTPAQALALRAAGVDALVGYLGAMTPPRLGYLTDAGLAFMPVTFAGHYDGAIAVAQCRALGLPAGTTVWLDLEGQEAFGEGAGITPKLAAWATTVKAAGFVPGLYVGVPQPLMSAELFALPFERYWRGQGSIRDRFNALAEPTCGWSMVQAYPQHMRAGVLVDDDMVQQDYRGRVPTVACSSLAKDTVPSMRAVG